MKIEINIYKQFDTDLVALCDSGAPVLDMMREALIAYANGQPKHFYLNTSSFFDMNGKKSVRFRMTVNDKKTIQVLKSIKHRYRNSFCKCVLRNALVQQNVACFFADDTLLSLQEDNRVGIPVESFRGLVNLSNEDITPIAEFVPDDTSKEAVHETKEKETAERKKKTPIKQAPVEPTKTIIEDDAEDGDTEVTVYEENTKTSAEEGRKRETAEIDEKSLLAAFDAL